MWAFLQVYKAKKAMKAANITCSQTKKKRLQQKPVVPLET